MIQSIIGGGDSSPRERVANYAALPTVGVVGVLYITLDDGKIFRRTGSAYAEVSPAAAKSSQTTGTAGENITAGDALCYKNGSAGQTIFYVNNQTIYAKSANTLGDGVAITTDNVGQGIAISPSGTSLVYRNESNSSRLYIRNADTTVTNGSQFTTSGGQNPVYDPDGNSVVYRISSGGDSGKLYKKTNLGDTSDGSAITASTQCDYPIYSPDGDDIVYTNGADGQKLYLKSEADALDGSAITSDGAQQSVYDPDGTSIYYVNQTNNNVLYHKTNLGDASNGSAINDIISFWPTISADGDYLYYTGTLFDEPTLFKKASGDTLNGVRLTTAYPTSPRLSSDDAPNEGYYQADANDPTRHQFVGFADTTVDSGETVTVNVAGIDDNQSSLTTGVEYYLSDTAGSISDTGGSVLIRVGKAVGATDLLIETKNNVF